LLRLLIGPLPQVCQRPPLSPRPVHLRLLRPQPSSASGPTTARVRAPPPAVADTRGSLVIPFLPPWLTRTRSPGHTRPPRATS
jgi:hypothetical protein